MATVVYVLQNESLSIDVYYKHLKQIIHKRYVIYSHSRLTP